tara:strand:+ start:2639 stop:3931 length:1293 start_codon:yes stop_codon:yes gene_type:complete
MAESGSNWGAIMHYAQQAAAGGTNSAHFGKRAGSFLGFISQSINAVTPVVAKHISDKKHEFDSAAEKAMNDATGELTDDEWSLRYDQVDSMRKDYIYGNRRERAEIMRKLDKLSNEQEVHNMTKIDIVEGALGTNGLNDNYKGTKQGDSLIGVLNGNTPITYNENTGEAGYILSNEDNPDNFEIAKDTFLSYNDLPLDAVEDWGLYDEENERGQEARGRIIDYYKSLMLSTNEKSREELDDMFGEKWYSATDVKKIIGKQSLDVVSRNSIMDKIQDDKQKSSNIVSGNGAFPYDAMYEDTRNTIVGLDGANLRSLGMDEMITGSGKTWFKDIQDALINSNYQQLGIPLTEDEAKEMDPTEGTPITPQDARVIARAIMRDEDLYKDFLTSYYTKIREQGWNQGATMRQNFNQPNNQTKGGSVVDGVFVPSK